MTDPQRRLRPGDRAPEIALPSATDDGVISLADAWGEGPALIALFRGLY